MRTFKLFDVCLQCILIAGAVLYVLRAMRMEGSLEQLLRTYFVVGGWQVISTVVHAIARYPAPRSHLRWWYQWTLAAIGVLVLVALLADSLVLVLTGLLFLAPALALCYTALCIMELFRRSGGAHH